MNNLINQAEEDLRKEQLDFESKLIYSIDSIDDIVYDVQDVLNPEFIKRLNYLLEDIRTYLDKYGIVNNY